jgi:hypothetical protein
MNPQIDPVAAKRLPDDPTLDRIIAVVGKASRQPDRDALRRDLLSCYGRYFAQPRLAAPIWARLSGRAAMGPLLWSPEVRSSPSFRHGKSYPVLWETGGHHPWARPSAIASNSALSAQSLSPRHPFWQITRDRLTLSTEWRKGRSRGVLYRLTVFVNK